MINTRLLHKIFAKINGYFWKPCPLCGEMFGGHEKHSKYNINHKGPMSKMVCKNCEPIAELPVREKQIQLFKTDLAKCIHSAGIENGGMIRGSLTQWKSRVKNNWINSNDEARQRAMQQADSVFHFLKESEILRMDWLRKIKP